MNSKLMSFKEVAVELGRSPDPTTRCYLWRLTKLGQFPAPVQVSSGRIAWIRHEVESWHASRTRVTYAQEVAQ